MSRKDVGVFARPCWPDTPINARFPYFHDYMFWIGDQIVSYARETGMEVHDKTREDAIRANIEVQLRDRDPIFFFHASHGGKNILAGQDMTKLICCPGASSCSNPNHEILSDRVVYTLSCSSADQLGSAVIQADGISYIGYADYLAYVLIERSDVDEAFKDILSSGAKELIDGKTTEEAYNKLKQKYEDWIEYWEKEPQSYIKPLMLNALKYDKISLKLLGKHDAIIRTVGEFVIANCAEGLGFFDQECNGYPIRDEKKKTCKAIDTCGIQAHAGYYMIGSGGKEFTADIDKYPLLYLTMKAEKDTDTCLLLVVHEKKPRDFMRRFVAVGITDSEKKHCGVRLAEDCFTIKDDNKWHDYTYDLRKLREDYPDAKTVRMVQFYSGKLCNGIQHAFHFSSLVCRK